MVLSLDTMHLKDPLVLFGFEGYAIPLPLFLPSPRINKLCHCSSTLTEGHFLRTHYGTEWQLCAEVPLSPHLFIPMLSLSPTSSKLTSNAVAECLNPILVISLHNLIIL